MDICSPAALVIIVLSYVSSSDSCQIASQSVRFLCNVEVKFCR